MGIINNPTQRNPESDNSEYTKEVGQLIVRVDILATMIQTQHHIEDLRKHLVSEWRDLSVQV